MEAFPDITLVTADTVLAAAIPAQLAHAGGVAAATAADWDAFLALSANQPPALLLLDWRGTGVTPAAVSALHTAHPLLALIHLSPPAEVDTTSHPLTARLQRPLSMPQLFRALKTLADRRALAAAQRALPFRDGLAFHQVEKVLLRGEERVELTDKEASLLSCLHRNRQDWLPREALLEEVWGYGEGVDTHTLETHLYRLRGKLKPLLGEQELIQTGQGSYRINPDML